MASLRFQALNAVLTRNIPEVKLPSRLSEIYACNVFDKKKMKEFLWAYTQILMKGITIEEKNKEILELRKVYFKE